MSYEVIEVPLDQELDALVAQYVAGNQAPGAAYGIASHEGLIHANGFGSANDEGLRPDLDTVFSIASMTKSFMACAALVARDNGLIALSDPITKYVPEFHVSPHGVQPDAIPTIGMLLSMCGGLTEDNSWVDASVDLPADQLLEIVQGGVLFSRQPGAAYEYSNLGFTMACLAVARATKQPLANFVRDEVLKPLGLDSTYPENAIPADVKRAQGYALNAEGDWVPFEPKANDAFMGAGGLASTVRDLTKWITWLGAAFRTASDAGEVGLSRSSRRELQRVHVVEPPALTVGAIGQLGATASGYGLGLRLESSFHRGASVSHSGGLPGFRLHMRWHPDSGVGVVVLTNSHRGDPDVVAREAHGRIFERTSVAATSFTIWPVTMDLRKRAEQLIRKWDDGLAADILAANVDFDQPLADRRLEIQKLIEAVGPLAPERAVPEVTSAVTPADITWAIQGEHGQLICMIHLTPVQPVQIQEMVVKAFPADVPRAAVPVDISMRRADLGDASITPITNTRVRFV